MVRTHVALSARGGQARQFHRTGVTAVARRAGANGAVRIRLADTVTLLATAGHCRPAFQFDERVRRPLRSSRLILFRKINLLGGEPLLAKHRRPRRRGMTAAQKLLVDLLMTAPAIPCRQAGFRNNEPV